MAKSNPVQIKFIFYDLQLPPLSGDSPKFDPPSMHLCTAMHIIYVHILEPKKVPPLRPFFRWQDFISPERGPGEKGALQRVRNYEATNNLEGN